MAYDERLLERMREALARKQGWTEKDLYGGRVCGLPGQPFVGVVEHGLIALCTDEDLKKHLQLKHCQPFAPKGKALPGWVLVSMDALKTAKQLSRWVEAGYARAIELKAEPKPRSKPAKARK